MVTLSLPYDWLSFGVRCREVEPEDYYLTVDSLDPAIIAFAPVAGSKDPRWVHRKKRFTSFLSPAQFGSAIPAGDGKLANLFFTV